MPRHRLLLLLGATVLAATACGASLSPAIDVNGDEVSRSDLLDQATELYQASELSGGEDSGTVPGDLTRELIGFRITGLLLEQELEAQGIEISDEHLASATGELEAQYAGTPDAELLVATWVDFVAARMALAEVVDDLNAEISEAFSSADIFVDPRFGTWDPLTGSVVAPIAPAQG